MEHPSAKLLTPLEKERDEQNPSKNTRSDPKPKVEVNRIGNRSGPDLRSDVPEALTVVWLKRDLRLADHAPFAAAADRAAETKTEEAATAAP